MNIDNSQPMPKTLIFDEEILALKMVWMATSECPLLIQKRETVWAINDPLNNKTA